MKRTVSVLILFGIMLSVAAAQSAQMTIIIENAALEKGDILIAVFNTKESYEQNNPPWRVKIPGDKENPRTTISLPAGEYVITAFQDENENLKLDTKLFGIPREPVGISNYSGRGIPGGFDKLKMAITDGPVEVIIRLSRI